MFGKIFDCSAHNVRIFAETPYSTVAVSAQQTSYFASGMAVVYRQVKDGTILGGSFLWPFTYSAKAALGAFHSTVFGEAYPVDTSKDTILVKLGNRVTGWVRRAASLVPVGQFDEIFNSIIVWLFGIRPHRTIWDFSSNMHPHGPRQRDAGFFDLNKSMYESGLGAHWVHVTRNRSFLNGRLIWTFLPSKGERMIGVVGKYIPNHLDRVFHALIYSRFSTEGGEL